MGTCVLEVLKLPIGVGPFPSSLTFARRGMRYGLWSADEGFWKITIWKIMFVCLVRVSWANLTTGPGWTTPPARTPKITFTRVAKGSYTDKSLYNYARIMFYEGQTSYRWTGMLQPNSNLVNLVLYCVFIKQSTFCQPLTRSSRV